MDEKLVEIKSKIDELAKILDVPEDRLPTFGYSEHSGRYHIEVDEKGYHLIALERGEEIKHITSSDVDEILYQIFQGVTFELGYRYEAKHRVAGQDSRRIIFAHQEELLSQLSPAWGARNHSEHAQVLERHPYNDPS